MKILFTGGGTMGSVAPLLAIHEQLKIEPEHEFLWLGTRSGPERPVVEHSQIRFKSIASGKWRRYFDLRNFVDPLFILLGFVQSLWLIWRFKPDVILTAGSFVCVPAAAAGAVLRKKIIVHQMDLKIGLANKIMQRLATRVTVAFDELRGQFPRRQAVVTGNPVRGFLLTKTKEQGRQRFHLLADLPCVLAVGGGIGSAAINQLVTAAVKDLTQFCQIIHITGRGEPAKRARAMADPANPRYQSYEFLGAELAEAFAAADLVVSRAGLGFLSELAALKKPSIIIPIPNNQQVDNAEFFYRKQAIVYVRQEDLAPDYFVNLIRDLFEHPEKLARLSRNIAAVMPANAAAEYVRVIKEVTA